MKKAYPPDSATADFSVAVALMTAGAGLYLSTLTKNCVFEGLARAMPIDLGQFRALFNGNYVLYGPLGAAFHALMRALGSGAFAVWSLQVMDALIGAAGLALFFFCLRRLDVPRGRAAAWAAVLGASFGYWSWSVDAQDYIFSTALLTLELLALAASLKKCVRPELLGVLQALAMLGHVVNAAFAPAAAFVVFSTSGRKGVARFAAAWLAAFAAAYGAVLAFIVRPESLSAARHWLLGSADTASGGMGWHGGLSLWSLKTWARMTLHVWVSEGPALPAPAWAPALLWAARAAVMIAACAAAYRLRNGRGLRRTMAVACVLWLAGYAAVFTSWEPNTIVYRVSDLVPMALLLALGVDSTAAAVPLAVLLCVSNYAAEIRPRTFESNNPRLVRMLWLKGRTPPGAWIAGEGGGDELYIPYFAERRPLLIGFYSRRPQDLAERLGNLLAAGQSVFITSATLESPLWRDFFAGWRLVEESRGADGVVLYRIKGRRT